MIMDIGYMSVVFRLFKKYLKPMSKIILICFPLTIYKPFKLQQFIYNYYLLYLFICVTL